MAALMAIHWYIGVAHFCYRNVVTTTMYRYQYAALINMHRRWWHGDLAQRCADSCLHDCDESTFLHQQGRVIQMLPTHCCRGRGRFLPSLPPATTRTTGAHLDACGHTPIPSPPHSLLGRSWARRSGRGASARRARRCTRLGTHTSADVRAARRLGPIGVAPPDSLCPTWFPCCVCPTLRAVRFSAKEGKRMSDATTNHTHQRATPRSKHTGAVVGVLRVFSFGNEGEGRAVHLQAQIPVSVDSLFASMTGQGKAGTFSL